MYKEKLIRWAGTGRTLANLPKLNRELIKKCVGLGVEGERGTLAFVIPRTAARVGDHTENLYAQSVAHTLGPTQ